MRYLKQHFIKNTSKIGALAKSDFFNYLLAKIRVYQLSKNTNWLLDMTTKYLISKKKHTDTKYPHI